MKHSFFAWLVAGSLLATSWPGVSQARSQASLSTPGTTRVLELPDAADHSPVISLGEANDPQSGELVQGYAIIHRHTGYARGGGKGGGGTTCYAYMASGAKWKSAEPWVMNPANPDSLSESWLVANVTANISKWEDAGNGVMGDSVGANILGDGTQVGTTLEADMVSPDNQNEVYFGNIDDPGVIGVTIVWGIWGGPPKDRQIVEWDQVYNTDYSWSDAGEAGEMDFENISTHELGHSTGLGDLYTSACQSETMYGYSDFAETSKRTLNAGDVTGINLLY